MALIKIDRIKFYDILNYYNLYGLLTKIIFYSDDDDKDDDDNQILNK